MSTPSMYSVTDAQGPQPQKTSGEDRSHITALPSSRDKVSHIGKKALDLLLDCTVRPEQGISRLIGGIRKAFAGKPKEPEYGFFTGIKHSSTIPSFFGKFNGLTIGNHVLLDPSVLNDRSTLQHEQVHIDQWRKYGAIGFLFAYGFNHITKGYDNNPFEIAASKAEGADVSRMV